MKTRKPRLKTGRPMSCPHCGESYMTSGEVSIVTALYAASEKKTVAEIANSTGACERTVRVAIKANGEWFESERRPEKSGRGAMLISRYTLSPAGRLIAMRITGEGPLRLVPKTG